MICKDANDWNLLNEQVLQLSKKHGQLKQAITKMVQVVMGFLDEIQDPKTKMSVIETLRTVTEGKVYMKKLRVQLSLRSVRYSSRLSGPGSHGFFRISRGRKETYMLLRTYYASSR
jgi:hypothetical protein